MLRRAAKHFSCARCTAGIKDAQNFLIRAFFAHLRCHELNVIRRAPLGQKPLGPSCERTDKFAVVIGGSTPFLQSGNCLIQPVAVVRERKGRGGDAFQFQAILR